jgi:hypothetical protein
MPAHQRGGLSNHERVVICAAQAENPAGLQTGQSNLPKRLGEFVLRPAEG